MLGKTRKPTFLSGSVSIDQSSLCLGPRPSRARVHTDTNTRLFAVGDGAKRKREKKPKRKRETSKKEDQEETNVKAKKKNKRPINLRKIWFSMKADPADRTKPSIRNFSKVAAKDIER